MKTLFPLFILLGMSSVLIGQDLAFVSTSILDAKWFEPGPIHFGQDTAVPEMVWAPQPLRHRDKMKSKANPEKQIMSRTAIFPGGASACAEFFAEQVAYPEEAWEYAIEGIVVVEFIVDPEGAVQQASVHQSLGYGCDEEALRLVEAMPAWTPAIQNGERRAMRVRMPISFRLD